VPEDAAMKLFWVGLVVGLCAFGTVTVSAQETKTIKIGVLNDQTSIYADLSGRGSVVAAKMAAEDFNNNVAGMSVEILVADHQNKPDIGSGIVRRWFDVENVDVVSDVPSSAVALAVQNIARDKKKIVLFSTAASSDLTGKECSPYSAQWVIDSYAFAHGLANGIVASGGKTWFFLTSNYAFGLALEAETSKVVKDAGGQVIGAVHHPQGTTDLASFLLQAQTSKAQIVGLATGGDDFVNAVKQAGEFGIVQQGQKLAALVVFISDIHSLGLRATQGIQLISAFYWDMNDETRAWSKRFFDMTGRMPSMVQAGVYSSIAHYLKTVAAVGSKDPDKIMAGMREMPVNDFMTKNGKLREDGRLMRDLYLFEVKAPSESKGPWDYYKLITTIPSEKAFRPLSEGGCPYLSK
jgi:branched-chain amino acid transport system substrate-binding protein